MSGTRFRGEGGRGEGGRGEAGRGDARRAQAQVQLPLLDRLYDEAPERAQDQPRGAADAMEALRRSVRRDLEMLLNAKRPWRLPPEALTELEVSPLSFGIPDCAGARFADKRERERLRQEIEQTLRRFEPRFAHVAVRLLDPANPLEPTLRLHIDALLHADPAPEPVAFDTVVDSASGVSVRALDV